MHNRIITKKKEESKTNKSPDEKIGFLVRLNTVVLKRKLLSTTALIIFLEKGMKNTVQ